MPAGAWEQPGQTRQHGSWVQGDLWHLQFRGSRGGGEWGPGCGEVGLGAARGF